MEITLHEKFTMPSILYMDNGDIWLQQTESFYIHIYVWYTELWAFSVIQTMTGIARNWLFCNYFEETNRPSSNEHKFLIALSRQDNWIDKIADEILWYLQVSPASVF